MPKRPDIYELLAAQEASKTTTTQLNSALKSTYIDKTNVDFWAGVITVSRALKDSRTYGHGLPIPEASEVVSVTVGDGASGELRPTGSEVWLVQEVSNVALDLELSDGTTDIAFSPGLQMTPLYLTNSLFIKYTNPGLSSEKFNIAYHKVSL